MLLHDTRDHDMGDTFLRGLYSTRQIAEDARTGFAFYPQSPHDDGCCSVEEWVIDDTPMHYGLSEKVLVR